MDVRQILIPRMANFAYIVADETSRKAAVIDPSFEPEKILDEAGRAGYSITHVINTHAHSDHISGNAELLEATGAELCVHEADAEQLTKLLNRALSRVMGGRGSPGPGRMLKDGDTIPIGDTTLSVIHTPGHSPGSICLYAPGHLFTGDTLFIGAVGRTDLAGSSSDQLLASIHEKLYTLPPETRVWPGHDYGDTPSSTIAAEKQNNPFT
ncbi:MAG TPA: MBL fold metallo-hydrolase [Desulfosalsimonadaceae bacterium]|nr:MBL fold metallo-hydrolase [Desulfosalsimonadaceae bacterium]